MSKSAILIVCLLVVMLLITLNIYYFIQSKKIIDAWDNFFSKIEEEKEKWNASNVQDR